MIKSLTVQIQNRSLFYLHKPSENPSATLIFIHGFPFSSAMWQSQLEALPDNIEGFAYDIRGFGNSGAGHNYFTIDLFAKDLLLFMDLLSVEKAVLCGISMGGYIALRAAQLNQPKIAGLILADTNALADTDEGKIKRFDTIEQILNDGQKDFAKAFLKNVFHERSLNANIPAVSLIENIILNTAPSTLCSTLLAMASRTATTEFLNKINVPSLILRGAEDKLMTNEQAEQLHEGISGSTLELIPDAGHLPNLENASVFNTLMNNFLHKHFPV